MKLLLSILMAMLPLAAISQTIDVELMNIRYYASTKCGDENPVLVKVCFKTSYPSPLDLNIVVVESTPKVVTYTGKVKECDANGNIYHSFCCKDGAASSFDVYFSDSNGIRSTTFSIFTKPD